MQETSYGKPVIDPIDPANCFLCSFNVFYMPNKPSNIEILPSPIPFEAIFTISTHQHFWNEEINQVSACLSFFLSVSLR